MTQRYIEESEDGFGAAVEIISALVYLVLIIPILFIVDLIRNRRTKRRGRHRA